MVTAAVCLGQARAPEQLLEASALSAKMHGLWVIFCSTRNLGIPKSLFSSLVDESSEHTESFHWVCLVGIRGSWGPQLLGTWRPSLGTGDPWGWCEAPALPVGFWGSGHVLTRCLPVSSQESSDSTHTTIEDEDTKGIPRLPACGGSGAGHWRVGSRDGERPRPVMRACAQGLTLLRAAVPPEPGYRPAPGSLRNSIQAEPDGPGLPEQRGSHCPGWAGSLHGPPHCSGGCAPSSHG